MPMTRMGIANVLRETFIKAKEYMKKKETNKDMPIDIGLRKCM